ncbi:MAG: aromatic ring-hydroxylating oxygenase subunit alpha [Alphaproteobacteria bacterium]
MSSAALDELKPGEARFPGPSTREVILSEGDDIPAALVEECYEFLGDEEIPYYRYTSPDFFQQEVEKMWPKVWQWACRLEHIPEVGDNYVYDVGPYSILVVRHGEAPDAIKAYHNSCLHRGTQLKPSHSTGNSPKLRCPFHGWEWNLDGTVNEIPCRWDFPKVTDEDFALPEVKVGLWGGFVFINMDPACEPLEDYLGPMVEHFAGRWDVSRRYVALHVQKTLPANWKACLEAFIEAYHSLETHYQSKETSGSLFAQYDVFTDKVNRFVHTRGYPTPEYRAQQTEEELLEKIAPHLAGTPIPEGKSARHVVANHLRETMGDQYGVDLSIYSDSEMLDSIEYTLFPNMFLFPGVGLPMVYRFRPNGMDPDSAIFDLLFLRPLADGMEAPEAPEPFKVGIEQSYRDAPGIDPVLGAIYDQDTGNLEMQQRGYKAAIAGGAKTGQTLGNYQEVRIRRMHMTLDEYLNA